MKRLERQIEHIKYDRDLSISTARSHNAIKWKNGSVMWSEFVKKISQTQRTNETVKEYNAASRTEKNKIKDVGGFVGGNLKDSRRKSGNVMNRSMLTLDIDFGDASLKDSIQMLVNYSYLLYSTHSHTEHKPRYRLVVPLARNVTSEEYEPVARKVAEEIGMDYFDDTSYEVARLMYWPSTSSDGIYDWHFEDNGLLDPDKVLSRYVVNWRDVLEWPTSSREGAKVQRLAKQQGDPYEKQGLIGAFNRAYTIHDVIDTYLSDVYTQHDENRYTYVDGSTAGGLVVYDDKFAYSHHGTDVISNKLVNAFDLLRLHKYGEQDVDTRLDAKVTSLPSYKAMVAFVQADTRVSAQVAEERLKEAEAEFGEIEVEDTEEDNALGNWRTHLQINKAGEFENTIPNILLVLEHDPRLKGKIAFNDFSNRGMRLGAVPWDKDKRHEYWTDDDDAGLRNYLERVYGMHNRSKTDDAIKVMMNKNAFHPVRDYLDGLEWDNVERLDRLFVKYLGAEDNELNRTATRIAFTAAVARVYAPGIKFDYMLTLYGAQGVGKSMIFNRMGKRWFSDSLQGVTGKEAFESLQGAWIVEMAELSATRKADIESIKHFISKREDRFRVAYGRHVEDFPRQCVFFGTTNDVTFLKDRTGNRRFWPITVNASKVEANWASLTNEEVDLLWAEAKYRYEAGTELFLPRALEIEMQNVQETHTEESPYYGVIQDFLNKKIPKDWEEMSIMDRRNYYSGEFEDIVDGSVIGESDLVERERVCSLEVWVECLGNEAKRFPTIERREINDILRNMAGWDRYEGNRTGRLHFGKNYGSQVGYVKQNFIDYDLI